jgi:hypothetical protein
MLLKPGWIIFLLMFWVVMQLIITFGYAVAGSTDMVIGDATIGTGGGTLTAGGLSSATLSPIQVLINSAVTFSSNPLGAVLGIGMDWGALKSALWQTFTFQAPFLSGMWSIISIFISCIYAGFTVAYLTSFVQRIL